MTYESTTPPSRTCSGVMDFWGNGDGSKVENRDGSKVNWDKLKGKMAEDVGPYQIGRFLKDPDFGLRVIKDGYGLFKGWSNFVGSAFEFNGMIYGDFSGRSQGEMQVEEG